MCVCVYLCARTRYTLEEKRHGVIKLERAHSCQHKWRGLARFRLRGNRASREPCLERAVRRNRGFHYGDVNEWDVKLHQGPRIN